MASLQNVPLGAALGYVQITTVTTAVGLGTIPAGATAAFIVAEAQAVRWRNDGTDPLAGVGVPLAVGDALFYQGSLTGLKFIEQAVGAKLNVIFYRSAVYP